MGKETSKGEIDTQIHMWGKRHTERNRDIEKQTHGDRTTEMKKS